MTRSPPPTLRRLGWRITTRALGRRERTMRGRLGGIYERIPCTRRLTSPTGGAGTTRHGSPKRHTRTIGIGQRGTFYRRRRPGRAARRVGPSTCPHRVDRSETVAASRSAGRRRESNVGRRADASFAGVSFSGSFRPRKRNNPGPASRSAAQEAGAAAARARANAPVRRNLVPEGMLRPGARDYERQDPYSTRPPPKVQPFSLFRILFFLASSLAKFDPRGNPRCPCVRAMLIPRHVSPGASMTGPELYLGHSPVHLRCTRAHPRMRASVSGGSPAAFRTSRSSDGRRGSDEPPGRPRPPRRRSRSTASQVSPPEPATGPEPWTGQVPVWAWCRSAHSRIISTVRRGRLVRFRAPRFSASSRASDVPPGSPRQPTFKSPFTAFQVRVPWPATGPEFIVGHRPV
jgi:hypothetical protein